MTNLVLFRVYQLLFSLIPLPIFFDLSTLTLVNEDLVAWGARVDIPFPIGGLAFLCIILLGFYLSFSLGKFTRRLIPNSNLILYYFFILPAFFFYAYFFSGLALIRIVQIIFPLIIMGMLSLPASIDDGKFIFQVLFISVSMFVLLHFLSLLLTVEDLNIIDQRKEFPFVFDFFIYQSAIYYPAVLVLYVYLLLVYSLFIRRSYAMGIMILILCFVAFSAGRKATLLEFVMLYSSILLFYFYFVFKSYKSVSKFLLYGFCIFIFLISIVFMIFFSSTGYVRLINSSDNLDSGRVDIYLRTLDLFLNNPKEFLFGFGGYSPPGTHNFLLDQVFRVGIFGILILFFIYTYFIAKAFSLKKLGLNSNQKLLFFILFVPPMVQSLFNASFSQPFYFLNFLVVFLVMYSYVSTKLRV